MECEHGQLVREMPERDATSQTTERGPPCLDARAQLGTALFGPAEPAKTGGTGGVIAQGVIHSLALSRAY